MIARQILANGGRKGQVCFAAVIPLGDKSDSARTEETIPFQDGVDDWWAVDCLLAAVCACDIPDG